MTFPTRTRCTTLGLIGLFSFLLSASPLLADDGQPIAIRHWDGDGFTVETFWGFAIGLGVDEENLSELPRKPDINLSDVTPGKSKTLQRLPNQAKLTISDGDLAEEAANALVVSRSESNSFTTVKADGLTILFLNDKPAATYLTELKAIGDKLVVPSENDESLVVIATSDDYDEAACDKIADFYKPHLMVVNSNIKTVGDREVEAVPHNTVAVSKTKRKKQTTRIVSLGTKPYQMSEKLTQLFAKKEAACEKSRSVFAKLSVNQLNFKPANGTHTPRWNTEHMMGRELMFFSQIYHAVDPEVPVMNLNPAQMPNKYKFAHPDWTGEEEARQTERVEAFTRRFAYLLDGMKLNKKAKGSRFWTPKSLLAQMERHYKEHTDNVVDKMKLEGWPEE